MLPANAVCVPAELCYRKPLLTVWRRKLPFIYPYLAARPICFMERFYDVTVAGQPMRLELHSTTVALVDGKVRIDIHPILDTDTLPLEMGLQFDTALAARATLASVAVSYLYPDQSYEEVLRRREIAQANVPS